MKTKIKLAYYCALMIIMVLSLLVFLSQTSSVQAQTSTPVVHAVLFYSPTCGHCEMVIRQTLPPLMEQYGEQFLIVGVDTTQPQGQVYFQAARDMFKLELVGVPFLVVGNEYLIGSVEIPEQLPSLIEKYLAQGGVDWPDIPGLREAIHASETEQAPTPTTVPPTSSASILTPTPVVVPQADSPSDNSFSLPGEAQMTVWERVMLDPIGNGIAIVVLAGMILVFIGALFTSNNMTDIMPPITSKITIPILCVLGLGVAGYLAYVETTQTTAICGPVGDCNTVQQSEYARLFGILPIGVVGVVGYLAILFSWGMAKTQNENIANLALLTMFILSAFGIIFSIYLTFLEPFVIGATCAWCVTSAIIMTALFVLTLRDGKVSYTYLRNYYFPNSTTSVPPSS